jgi:hypothetical protein
MDLDCMASTACFTAHYYLYGSRISSRGSRSARFPYAGGGLERIYRRYSKIARLELETNERDHGR